MSFWKTSSLRYSLDSTTMYKRKDIVLTLLKIKIEIKGDAYNNNVNSKITV